MKANEFLFEQINHVTVNRRLNPKIWVDEKVTTEVKHKLIKIAEKFEEFVGVPLDVVDYTLTGSNANYTWTEYSDLDLHIVVKGMPDLEQRELYNAKKALWSEQHNISIKGIPVEVYIQGQEEPHHSTGVYSLMAEQWMEKPKKIKPRINDTAVRAKKESLIHDIETAIGSGDVTRLRSIKDKMTKMRKSGLERAGEWSIENVVFKNLRNLGLVDKLNDEIKKLEDEELSLEATRLLDSIHSK